jgi:hypothetical protein
MFPSWLAIDLNLREPEAAADKRDCLGGGFAAIYFAKLARVRSVRINEL